MKTKGQCQKIHALKRANQRYSVSLSTSDYIEICSLIKNSKATILQKQSNRVNICSVLFKSKLFVLAYDKQRHTIATFLPEQPEFLQHPGWIEPISNREIDIRLQSPKCPECDSFGEKVLWYSGIDTVTFSCIKCQTKWSEITQLRG